MILTVEPCRKSSGVKKKPAAAQPHGQGGTDTAKQAEHGGAQQEQSCRQRRRRWSVAGHGGPVAHAPEDGASGSAQGDDDQLEMEGGARMLEALTVEDPVGYDQGQHDDGRADHLADVLGAVGLVEEKFRDGKHGGVI